MAPNQGLVHPKKYDIKDSNVELIGSDIDHRVKFKSAQAEPAWNEAGIGSSAGLFVWRIEDFAVVRWPESKRGIFYDGDSFIVLHSYRVGDDKLGHDVFFWLGAETSQDEAGTAAYKTVELDEFLHGAASQHRETQETPSDEFLELFPRITIRRGGVASGFRHVEEEPDAGDVAPTLLRVSMPEGAKAQGAVVVQEVEPTWESLDDGDVFILDVGDKIWVWQGSKSKPMEKATAAQTAQDIKTAKHSSVDVVSQTDGRSRTVIKLLGGGDDEAARNFSRRRHVASPISRPKNRRPPSLFRISDASGTLSFSLVSQGPDISPKQLDPGDVFLLDDKGEAIWVWIGSEASGVEKALWLKVTQHYVRELLASGQDDQAYLTPIAAVKQDFEPASFSRAISSTA